VSAPPLAPIGDGAANSVNMPLGSKVTVSQHFPWRESPPILKTSQ
jgi:hypothetical protein